jgi:hypothetical protein
MTVAAAGGARRGLVRAVLVAAVAAGVAAGVLFTLLAGEVEARADLELTISGIEWLEDAGFSVERAEAMTADPEFRQRVLEAIGDESFDYGRFDVRMEEFAAVGGSEWGTLQVGIRDGDAGDAERYRDAFTGAFTEHWKNPDGLFRRQPVANRERAAALAESSFAEAYAALLPKTDQLGLPLAELLRAGAGTGTTLADELNKEEIRLRAELALIDATLALPALANSSFQASIILDVGVPEGAGELALRQRREIIVGAINLAVGRRNALSDGGLPPEILGELDNLRGLAEVKREAFVALNEARIAAEGIQTDLQVEASTVDTPAGRWWAGTLVGLGAFMVMIVLGAAARLASVRPQPV